MVKTLKTPSSTLQKGHGKNKQFEGQMKIVFAAFFEQPKTMLMVEVETGIMRSNICRYVAKWKKRETISIVSFGICPISKHNGVQKLTTNAALFPKSNQIKLF
jgi:hypothetical protein